MESKRIIPALIGTLVLACIVLAAVFFALRSDSMAVPDSAVDDLVKLLREENITVDRDMIRQSRETGTVYLCSQGDYSERVAELISGTSSRATYQIPGGSIIVTMRDEMFSFGDDFAFSYYKSGTEEPLPDFADVGDTILQPGEAKLRELEDIISRFLESGSRSFESNEQISSTVRIESVQLVNGRYYVLVSRKLDGVEVTGNTVLCTIAGDEVIEARGTWCFLTLGEEYSAQLTDILNILFSVKKEISAENIDSRPVRIESVERCFSLYFYGEDDSFCLIPCWKVTTDRLGEYIYNAIDGELYTKN